MMALGKGTNLLTLSSIPGTHVRVEKEHPRQVYSNPHRHTMAQVPYASSTTY